MTLCERVCQKVDHADCPKLCSTVVTEIVNGMVERIEQQGGGGNNNATCFRQSDDLNACTSCCVERFDDDDKQLARCSARCGRRCDSQGCSRKKKI